MTDESAVCLSFAAGPLGARLARPAVVLALILVAHGVKPGEARASPMREKGVMAAEAGESSDGSDEFLFLSGLPDWVWTVVGDRPWGTNIDRLRHMSFAFSMQSPPGITEVLTGFRYSERASALVQLIASSTARAAAQAEANRRQTTVGYTVPFDQDATFGLSLEFAKSPGESIDGLRGDGPLAFAIGLDNFTYLGRDTNDLRMDSLPVTLRWGLVAKYWKARNPVVSNPNEPPPSDREIFRENAYFGLVLDFAFPVTRWAQINAELSGGYPDVELGVYGTVHLGNRFFVKTGSSMTGRTLGHLGLLMNLGVRL